MVQIRKRVEKKTVRKVYREIGVGPKKGARISIPLYLWRQIELFVDGCLDLLNKPDQVPLTPTAQAEAIQRMYKAAKVTSQQKGWDEAVRKACRYNYPYTPDE